MNRRTGEGVVEPPNPLVNSDPDHMKDDAPCYYSSVVCMCSGSVVVTAYDSESGHPGSNPEWGLIYYEASITAQGLPEPSSLRGSTLGTRAAEHKGCYVTGACKLIDGCGLALCSATVSVVSAGICHRNEVNSIA